jgi:coenzyme F420-0:L-glutamate ligase/coenzyme F420-1:gamma-L-glutamate ligase
LSEARKISVLAVSGIGEIGEGDRLGAEIGRRAPLEEGDIVVVSQKVVSKAEGRVRRLSSVIPGGEARRLAAVLGKEPALVELILEESAEVIRAERGVLITETPQGWICANAGIDSSNVPAEDSVSLLPEDADASARRIRAEILQASGLAPAVIVSDSFGRAWRLGQCEVAIGCAGLEPLDDWTDRRDRHGRKLEATRIAVADEAAAAADLVRGKDSGVPAVIVRGLGHHVIAADGPGATALRRARNEDLFR